MTTEVDVPSGPLKGESEVVERVGGECNGASHHHEEEGLVSNGKGNGSHVLVTGIDGVCGTVDDQVVADLKAEKDSVNGDGGDGVALELEGHGQGSVIEDSAVEEQNGVVASEELVQEIVVDDEVEGLLVDDSGDQSETMVSKDLVQGSNTDAGSEGLLVEAAVSNSSEARYQNGTVVVPDLRAENAVSSAEKDSANGDDELKLENRVTGDCNLESDGDGVVLKVEEPCQKSVTDTSAVEEQNGAVDSQELTQLSAVGDESEELLVDDVVSDSSAAREQSETMVSKDQVQGSTADAGSEGLLVEAAVSSSSIARYQNGTEVEDDLRAENVVSLDEKDSVNGHNELKVENGVNSNCISQGDGDGDALEPEEPNQGSVTDSRAAAEPNGEVASEELAQMVGDDEPEELLVDAAVSDGSAAREQNEALISNDQVQGSIADAGSKGLLIEDAVSNGSVARYQNRQVVSEDQVQGNVAVAESDRLLVDDAAVMDSGGARDQNGTVVPDDQVEGSIDAVHEALLVDTAVTDTDVAREQNGTVISEDQEQGSMDVAAAEPEACVVNTGDQNDAGLTEQVEESKNQTVSIVESSPTGGVGAGQIEVESCEDASDIISSKALTFDVTYHGSGDCKAPLLDAGKLSNGESNLELAQKVPEDDVAVSKELHDNERVCDREESGESEITVQSPAEFEPCPPNGGIEIKESQESPVIVDLEQEKKLGDVANEIIPEVALENTETPLEQIPKAVSSGEIQTAVVNGGHPDAEFINKAQGGLNPEAHVPCDDPSNLPEEASAKSFENAGQPANADGESDNIHVEANTDNVDTGNVHDTECERSAKIETSTVDDNAEDGEAQLGETTSEFVEEESENTVVQINVKDGETLPTETTSEFVEEESKNTVFQITEGEANKVGDAQLVETTSELVEESIQDSKNGVAQITESETDVHHAEANSKSDTVGSGEHGYVSNELAEGEEASVDEMKVAASEIETEVGELSQPAEADSETFCSSGPPVEKKPFYFMIKVPRFDESKLREEMELSRLKLEEKTNIRDAIMAEVQPERIIRRELWETFQDFVSEQKKLQAELKSKRQEVDSHQFLMNKVRDAMSMDDIDERIRNMKHMIEHESLPLKEEKQYVREMEKLKQTREDLSSNMGRKEEVQNTSEQKDQIQKQMKLLKKELDLVREKYNKAQSLTTAARKKYDDQNAVLQPLEADYRNANQCRQQEYLHLQSLKGALKEKNKYFWKYKDDTRAAYDYAKKDKDALQQHCINQVESFMELWNKNDEFRKEYVDCNLRSTLRRLGTHDGRSLGPDEEPPIIPNAINWFNSKTSVIISAPEEKAKEAAAALPMEPKKSENANNKVIVTKKQVEDTPNDKVMVMKKQIVDTPKDTVIETKKIGKLKPDPVVNNSTPFSGKNMVEEEASEEVTKVVVVEDEIARKAEALRKEEEASRLEEQLRLEQKAKAKEALERKKRKAEKAQARAEFRAKKEQEEKNRKMEKKKAALVVGTSNETQEAEQQSSREAPIMTKEPEHQEKPSTTVVTKRSAKPLRYTKSKAIPPPPLRNRGKRRMQTWMWFLVGALVVFALVLAGSSDFISKLGLHKFAY